jgi:LasA protease
MPKSITPSRQVVALTISLVMLGGATAANAAPVFPTLALPFAAGQTTGSAGVHSDNGSTGVKNAIDFNPYDGITRAAGAGTVHLQHCAGGDWVTVDHTDGWRTGYYHLENIQVTDGQQVEAGAALGNIGNALPCGGSSSGAHVHFTLWQLDASGLHTASDIARGNWNGLSYEQVSGELAAAYGEPVDGKVFGGWRFTEGSVQYSGTATRESDGFFVQLPGYFRYDAE